jgi:hypothetical protein
MYCKGLYSLPSGLTDIVNELTRDSGCNEFEGDPGAVFGGLFVGALVIPWGLRGGIYCNS